MGDSMQNHGSSASTVPEGVEQHGVTMVVTYAPTQTSQSAAQTSPDPPFRPPPGQQGCSGVPAAATHGAPPGSSGGFHYPPAGYYGPVPWNELPPPQSPVPMPHFAVNYGASSSKSHSQQGSTKKKLGRPKGSKNKKKRAVPESDSDESCEEILPSVSAGRRSQKPAQRTQSSETTCLILPAASPDDIFVPTLRGDRCSKCSLWVGKYILLPCNHYQFCMKCLEKKFNIAKIKGIEPLCPCCKQIVTGYIKGFRCCVFELKEDS